MKYSELNGTEKLNMNSILNSTFKPRVVKIKMNFGILLMKNEPSEFSIADKPFFDKYKNREVVIIKDSPSETDYFILEDNNYVIYDYCFDELGVKC